MAPPPLRRQRRPSLEVATNVLPEGSCAAAAAAAARSAISMFVVMPYWLVLGWSLAVGVGATATTPATADLLVDAADAMMYAGINKRGSFVYIRVGRLVGDGYDVGERQ